MLVACWYVGRLLVGCWKFVGGLLVGCCWVHGSVMFGSRQVFGRLLVRIPEVVVAGC